MLTIYYVLDIYFFADIRFLVDKKEMAKCCFVYVSVKIAPSKLFCIEIHLLRKPC
jgi:hypothetical protein